LYNIRHQITTTQERQFLSSSPCTEQSSGRIEIHLTSVVITLCPPRSIESEPEEMISVSFLDSHRPKELIDDKERQDSRLSSCSQCPIRSIQCQIRSIQCQAPHVQNAERKRSSCLLSVTSTTTTQAHPSKSIPKIKALSVQDPQIPWAQL